MRPARTRMMSRKERRVGPSLSSSAAAMEGFGSGEVPVSSADALAVTESLSLAARERRFDVAIEVDDEAGREVFRSAR